MAMMTHMAPSTRSMAHIPPTRIGNIADMYATLMERGHVEHLQIVEALETRLTDERKQNADRHRQYDKAEADYRDDSHRSREAMNRTAEKAASDAREAAERLARADERVREARQGREAAEAATRERSESLTTLLNVERMRLLRLGRALKAQGMDLDVDGSWPSVGERIEEAALHFVASSQIRTASKGRRG